MIGLGRLVGAKRDETRERSSAALRPIVEYRLLSARRFWRSVVIVGVVTPLLYVLALGVGLGTVVNRHGTDQLGVPYLVFVAPAFLAAAALQVATGEAAYPVMAGFKWLRTFHGMAATPLRPAQICDGTLTWIALRVFANSVVYLAIMAGFGAAQRWQVVLAVPVATLTGIAFAHRSPPWLPPSSPRGRPSTSSSGSS